ncbi:hypothetical protein CC78DRAFT_316679 [Lojkania enalia]|uniref:Uncharacterized protein n=1 Tax=Lojkania enalia TaxID=147567 RepID=A0A9P4K5Q1_9PLEO|nr:hypothetical protein CC78DRAFT_316679 [Didymosphaeria enalia]
MASDLHRLLHHDPPPQVHLPQPNPPSTTAHFAPRLPATATAAAATATSLPPLYRDSEPSPKGRPATIANDLHPGSRVVLPPEPSSNHPLNNPTISPAPSWTPINRQSQPSDPLNSTSSAQSNSQAQPGDARLSPLRYSSHSQHHHHPHPRLYPDLKSRPLEPAPGREDRVSPVQSLHTEIDPYSTKADHEGVHSAKKARLSSDFLQEPTSAPFESPQRPSSTWTQNKCSTTLLSPAPSPIRSSAVTSLPIQPIGSSSSTLSTFGTQTPPASSIDILRHPQRPSRNVRFDVGHNNIHMLPPAESDDRLSSAQVDSTSAHQPNNTMELLTSIDHFIPPRAQRISGGAGSTRHERTTSPLARASPANGQQPLVSALDNPSSSIFPDLPSETLPKVCRKCESCGETWTSHSLRNEDVLYDFHDKQKPAKDLNESKAIMELISNRILDFRREQDGLYRGWKESHRCARNATFHHYRGLDGVRSNLSPPAEVHESTSQSTKRKEPSPSVLCDAQISPKDGSVATDSPSAALSTPPPESEAEVYTLHGPGDNSDTTYFTLESSNARISENSPVARILFPNRTPNVQSIQMNRNDPNGMWG